MDVNLIYFTCMPRHSSRVRKWPMRACAGLLAPHSHSASNICPCSIMRWLLC